MSRNNSKNWKSNNRGKGNSNSNQKNNYQDKAEEREYNKGYRAGKDSRFKGVKPSRNFKKGDDLRSVAISTGSSDNDPQWYTPNGQMLKDVSSVPFYIRSGYPLSPNGEKLYQTVGSAGTTFVPGIMAHYIIPTFGDADDAVNPLNTAATAFFTSLRRATSGTSYYDKEDAMLYLLGVGNAYSYYSYIIRAYGTLSEFSSDNVYLPSALLHAMGIDYNDCRSNISTFRTWINSFAYELQSIPIPNVLTYITRQVFLYESVYTDANSLKSQYSLYSPVGFYVYSEGTEENPAGMLNFKPLPCFKRTGSQAPVVLGPNQSGLMKVSDLISYGESLLAPIQGSQDMSQYIASDIIKAYGSNVYSVSPIAETFRVTPVYNTEVLSQMENLYSYGLIDVNISLTQSIAVNDSRLVPNYNFYTMDSLSQSDSNVAVALYKYLDEGSIIINSHKSNVTPEDVMVMTRLSGAYPNFELITSGSGTIYTSANYKSKCTPVTMGSEIVASTAIYFYSSARGVGQKVLTGLTYGTEDISYVDKATISTELAAVVRDQLLATFDWHPPIRRWLLDSTIQSPPAQAISGYIYDLDNYTTLSLDLLKQINRAALLGEFASRLELFSK